jgi:hypothetical protein
LLRRGSEAVIYLAPPTVSDAVRDEALIVARQGLMFVNIPIKFDNPTEKDFETFTSVLSALATRKVLVPLSNQSARFVDGISAPSHNGEGGSACRI